MTVEAAEVRKVLITLGVGPMRRVLDQSLPTFEWFAQRHGYNLIVGDVEANFDRPVPWAKISLIRSALRSYDLVLWIDSDAIVLDDSFDPAELLPDSAFQAMVQHQSSTETCPNTGVWLLRRGSQTDEFLQLVWNSTEFIHDSWWENAAVMDLLGYSLRPAVRERDSPWYPGTYWLPNEWNSHVGWNGLVPARIRHYAGVSNSERVRNMRVDLHGVQAAHGNSLLKAVRLGQYAWGEFMRRPAVVLRAIGKRLRSRKG